MGNNTIFFADGNSPKMIEAFKNAQKTFKYFWRELSWEQRRIIPALAISSAKIAFSQEIDGEIIVEHMWISVSYFDGNNVTGTLLNSPNDLTNIENGDYVDVPLDQISDWLFASYKKNRSEPVTYGGFTIQAIRSEMTEKERKKHDQAWGLDFGDFNEILVVTDQVEHPENLIEHPMSVNMKEKFVEFLEEYPEELTTKNDSGLTLLHTETIAGNLTSVELLLQKGADKNIKSNDGETALDFAKKLNWEHIIPILEN